LATEAELFKLKHKVYPRSGTNLGEGYSQFHEDSTRLSILKRVKELIKRRAGLSGAGLLERSERLLRVLDNSIKLLKVNYNPAEVVRKHQAPSAADSCYGPASTQRTRGSPYGRSPGALTNTSEPPSSSKLRRTRKQL